MTGQWLPPRDVNLSFCGPITSPQEALVLGNGDLGALVMVASHQVHIILGKNDCWDARFDYDPQEHLLRHSDLVRLVEEYDFSYPHPGPGPKSEKTLPEDVRIPALHSSYHKQFRYSSPAPKRVAEIIIEHPGLSTTTINGEVRLADACFSVTYGYREDCCLTIEAFIHAKKNIVSVRLIPKGEVSWCRLIMRKNPDAVDLSLPAPKVEELENELTRISQHIPSALEYEPFEWDVTTKLPGNKICFAYEVHSYPTLRDNVATEFSVAVATSREYKDPAHQSVALIQEISEKSWESNKVSHDLYWQEFWSKSGVRMADKELEAAWYADLYGLACNIREGANCPGLSGNMVPWDGAIWHSDYHFNCNIEKTFLPIMPVNHLEMGLAYADLVEYCMPTWRWIAKHVYGVEGIMVDLAWFPYQPSDKPYLHPLWGREIGLIAWVLQPLWRLWEYTHDIELLRKRIYPVIKEASDFCYNYLLKYQDRPGGDLYPSMPGECRGWTKQFEFNRNIPSDIAFFRQCFKRAVVAAETLGVDADCIARWHTGIRRLPDDAALWHARSFMDNNANGQPEFLNVPHDDLWARSHLSYRIYPCEDFDTTVDNETLLTLRRQGAEWPIQPSIHGAWTFIPASVRLHDANAYKRVRQTMLANRLPTGLGYIDRAAKTGQLQVHWGQLTENFWMNFAITELLLQSHNGVIQLFPTWPYEKDAKFEALRAEGGFLISASLVDSEIRYVRIVSEAGEPCTILWSCGQPQFIEEGTGQPVIVKGKKDRWTFLTKPGEVYIINE